MLAVTKNTFALLEELNEDKKEAMRVYLEDQGLDRHKRFRLRRGKSMSSNNIRVIQQMVFDLKLKTETIDK